MGRVALRLEAGNVPQGLCDDGLVPDLMHWLGFSKDIWTSEDSQP